MILKKQINTRSNIEDFYKRLNFKNKDEFNKYLKSYNLNIR